MQKKRNTNSLTVSIKARSSPLPLHSEKCRMRTIHLHLWPTCQQARHKKKCSCERYHGLTAQVSAAAWGKSLVLLSLFSNHYWCSWVFSSRSRFLLVWLFNFCDSMLLLIFDSEKRQPRPGVDYWCFKLLKSILRSSCIITSPEAVTNAPLHNKRTKQIFTDSWQSSRLLGKILL